MASVTNDAAGRKRVQFVAGDGARKAIRLGKVSIKQANAFKVKLENLIGAGITGNIDDETSRWVAAMDDRMHARLAAVGLAKARTGGRDALGPFIDGYLIQRNDLKPGTIIVMKQARRWLVKFLGETKPLAEVTPGDADAYRAHLQGAKRAKATVAKWCYYARHFFRVAHRRQLIAANPFEHIRGSVRGNPARRVFVPAEDVRKVIDAVIDPQWKLLIALGRWGGLRIPSEAFALTWGDVDFEHLRFTVRASKTEHHADGGIRIVPMFPELVKHFQAAFDVAPEGSIHVISRYREPAQNLRTQLNRYITLAGLKPWPKPWQNMRASRATDLADHYPSHVCAAWLGHTEAVADEFYRQVTNEHFAKAQTVSIPVSGGKTAGARDAKAEEAKRAAQNPAQYPVERPRMEKYIEGAKSRKPLVLQGNSASYETVQDEGLGALGFEPRTKEL
jgi:integrase